MVAKIAFLFLVISDVYHQGLWQNFFKNNESSYSLYVHSKEKLPAASFFAPYEIKDKIPTTWANTMYAQIVLLQEALKDPANQKFVFISETTIPFTSFNQVYHDFFRHDNSIFSFYPNPHLPGKVYEFSARDLSPIPSSLQYECTQWVVLNRKHAELMVNDNYYIHIITKHPADQEHYPATLLAAHNLLNEVEMRDTTFVSWECGPDGKVPYCFYSLNDPKQFDTAKKALSGRWLFARKIHKNCALTKIYRFLPYMN